MIDSKLKYKICLGGIILTCLVLMTTGPAWAVLTGTLDYRVEGIQDDAEQTGSSVNWDINDLELGDKICGIRFRDVKIPKGSTITRAYIQFTVDETRSETTNLTIWGHARYRSGMFWNDDNDISRRDKTSASVAWNDVPEWGNVLETGVAQQTPDLSAIVQEIIDIPDWAYDNAITFIIEGSGERVGKAYKSGADKAPLLHVEYVSNAFETRITDVNDDVEEKSDGEMYLTSPDLDFYNSTDRGVGLRFQNVTIPQGALIAKAYIELVAHNEGAATLSGSSGFVINGEATGDAPPFTSANNNLSTRPLTNQSITWDPVPAWDLDQSYRTPDLSPIVQEIVGRTDWADGQDMAFIFTHGFGWRCSYSYDTDPDMAALLRIEFSDKDAPYITTNDNSFGASSFEGSNPMPETLTITNAGSAVMNFTLAEDATWLTLSSSVGSIASSGSTDISVNYSAWGLPMGTYTATITITVPDAPNSPFEIPISLTILEKYQTYDCGHVPLYAENLINPAVLILLDVSGSMRNEISVSSSSERPQTPDLSPIVQEIVDRAGWKAGNSMAFLIGGSGRRTAISFDQHSGYAPLLRVSYNDGADHDIEVRVSQSTDDAEERLLETWVHLTSADLEMVDDDGNGDQIIGVRFQNVNIPTEATITKAYIEFAVDEPDSVDTDLTIWGEDMDDPPTFADQDNGISGRTKTTAKVDWSGIPAWSAGTTEPKIDIAKSTIIDLIKDRSIAWGFGSWVADRNPYDGVPDYTIVHEGCKPNTAAHRTAIETAVNAVTPSGNTPFAPSIEAARKYFTSNKPEDEEQTPSGDAYLSAECQPKFLINITDGIGNKGSTVATVNTNTAALADEEVTPIAVGFGLPPDQADQIYEMSKVANQKGKASGTDDIFALHEEDGSGVGLPFFAYSKEELINSMSKITENIKGAVFHGSAPAPTTSVDLGDTVIVAKFDAARWTGDVDAVAQDANGLWVNTVWSASEKLPATRKIWTIDPNDVNAKTVIPYVDTTLATDNFGCNTTKPIGDIVNSTPVVVGMPPFWYPFDGYPTYALNSTRDTMIYIGANDGSLHAIRLSDGVEQWAFVPKSMHDKLNKAETDPLFDRCAPEFCHQYYVDGSPIAGDIYADFGGATDEWRTILVTGEREGGEAYFALDITYGKQFNDALEPTKFLWEFTDSELGQTWGDPSISRVAVKSSTDKAWATFFGSGYMTDPVQQAGKEAYLYGILAHDAGDLWTNSEGDTINKVRVNPHFLVNVDAWSEVHDNFMVGEMVIGQVSGATGTIVAIGNIAGIPVDRSATFELKDVSGTFVDNEQLIGSGTGRAFMNGNQVEVAGDIVNDALSSPLVVDMEGNYEEDRIYVGNLYGNMYRVLDIGKGMTPKVSTLFTFNHTSPDINPIRAKASYAYGHNPGDIWIYFGSGRYETHGDKTDTNQQYFFGLKDSATPVTTYTPDYLVTLQAKFATVTIDGEDKTVRYVNGTNDYAEPWKMQLYEGTFSDGPNALGTERVITQPLVLGGVVFFTTFIPDENICAGSGETWVFAVNYDSGLAASEAIFDLNGDGAFSDADKILVDGTEVVPIGIKVGRGKGSLPVLHKDTLFITVTGDGDDGGGSGSDDEDFFAKKVNLPAKKIKLNSWIQN